MIYTHRCPLPIITQMFSRLWAASRPSVSPASRLGMVTSQSSLAWKICAASMPNPQRLSIQAISSRLSEMALRVTRRLTCIAVSLPPATKGMIFYPLLSKAFANERSQKYLFSHEGSPSGVRITAISLSKFHETKLLEKQEKYC
nr:hypothetical protein [Sphingobium yanoikuyae]